METVARLSCSTEVHGGDFQQADPRDPSGSEPERERFIAAFGKVASEHGYHELTVELVARYAGTSQAQIERHFASKEEGLVAAHHAFLNRIWFDVLEACESAAEWPLKVRAALRTVLYSLSEAGTLARVFTIEATAASFAAAERQFSTLDDFARMLRDGRRIYPQASELPAATERVLVGGIASILFAHLLAEEPGALATLEADLVELLLLPFLGPHQAKQVARS
jgi:AcrR family transcriptional regulator